MENCWRNEFFIVKQGNSHRGGPHQSVAQAFGLREILPLRESEISKTGKASNIVILKDSEKYTKLMTITLYILREKGGWILEN